MALKIRRRSLVLAVLPLVMLALSGCTASRLYRAMAPSVVVSNFALGQLSLSQQTFIVGLKVSNPNSFALPVAGIGYTVRLNDKKVAEGVTRDSFTVPANGSESIRVSIPANLLDSMGMFQGWGQLMGKTLDYNVSGTMQLKGVPIGLPFNYADSVTLEMPG